MLDTMQSFRALMSKTYGAKDQSLVFATVKRHAVFQRGHTACLALQPSLIY